MIPNCNQYECVAQQGHPSPCTLGPLCPYCEIEKYKAELREIVKAGDALAKIADGWVDPCISATPIDMWRQLTAHVKRER